MSRNCIVPVAFKLAILVTSLGACTALADPPAKLPPLPPPQGKLPPIVVPEKMPAAAPVPVTLVPVELTIPIADLKKQMLKSIAQQIDPKAEPVLPLVVKGNTRNLPPADAKQPEAKQPEVKQVELRKPVLPEPKKVMPELPPPALANDPEMRPNRPRIFGNRPPGTRPVLERIAERPLVQGIVKQVAERVAETSDLDYRIELRTFDLTIIGNTLTCEVGGGFHAEGKAAPVVPGQPAPVPANIRDIGIKLRVTKDLVWSDAGKLELKEGSSKVWIDPETPVIGFPRLDIARILQLNGLLGLVGGVLDRELMKRIPTDNMPDLAKVAPQIKDKVPFLAVQEITAYPLRGDEKDLHVCLVIGFVPSNKKVGDEIKISSKTGPFPEPKFKGTITFDKDGKPDVKLEPIR
ncbi:MAG: hypothetical protein K8U57_07355 [Planctomycetes bacterium]|nr:hypothetical protein [Planctomycetota bacterium]